MALFSSLPSSSALFSSPSGEREREAVRAGQGKEKEEVKPLSASGF